MVFWGGYLYKYYMDAYQPLKDTRHTNKYCLEWVVYKVHIQFHPLIESLQKSLKISLILQI